MTSRTIRLEAVSCGVCGSNRQRYYASGKDYEYGTSDDVFQMVECLDCGNIYLNPRPAAEELPVIYPPNYYAYNYDAAVNPVAIQAKNWLDGLKVRQWLRYLPSTSQIRFLDVGCGNGRYLKMLHELGIPKENLYGVELSQEPIIQLQKSGFQGYYGRIEDVAPQLPKAGFDLIVLLQVLEHVDQPSTMVATLSQLLKPGGLLIIETPNTESIDVRLFKSSYWGGYHFPRHWNLMSQKTLRRLAEQNQLQIRAFNFLPSHSFWIFSLHHLIAHKWRMPKLAAFFNPFQNLFLLALFTSFDIVRARIGFSTSNIQMVATPSLETRV